MYTRDLCISWPIWVIFSVEDLHIMSSYEFCENCCSESNSLLTGVGEIFPYFLHFLSDFNRIQYRSYPQILLSDY